MASYITRKTTTAGKTRTIANRTARAVKRGATSTTPTGRARFAR